MSLSDTFHYLFSRRPTGASADETFEAGRLAGVAQGWLDAQAVVRIALAEFPTSLGGRAIARAVGVEVPPLPRYAAKPPAPLTVAYEEVPMFDPRGEVRTIPASLTPAVLPDLTTDEGAEA